MDTWINCQRNAKAQAYISYSLLKMKCSLHLGLFSLNHDPTWKLCLNIYTYPTFQTPATTSQITICNQNKWRHKESLQPSPYLRGVLKFCLPDISLLSCGVHFGDVRNHRPSVCFGCTCRGVWLEAHTSTALSACLYNPPSCAQAVAFDKPANKKMQQMSP